MFMSGEDPYRSQPFTPIPVLVGNCGYATDSNL